LWVRYLTDRGSLNATPNDVCDAASKLADDAARGNRESIEALTQVLDNGDEDARCFAAAALGAANLAAADGLLLAPLGRGVRARDTGGVSSKVREAYVAALARAPNSVGGERILHQVLDVAVADPSADVRFAAVVALGTLSCSLTVAITNALADRIDDEDERVRVAAVVALARLATAEYGMARRILLDATSQQNDPDVRAAAALGLMQVAPHGDSTSINALLDMLAENCGQVCPQRRAAAVSLGALTPVGKERVITALLEAASDDTADVRQAALASFVKVAGKHDPRVKAILLEVVDDDEPEVRQLVAAQLGEISQRGDEQILAALTLYMDDDNVVVRRCAARSLGRVANMGDEKVLRLLLRNMDENDWAVRYEAMDALEALVKLPEDRAKLSMWRRHFVPTPGENLSLKLSPNLRVVNPLQVALGL